MHLFRLENLLFYLLMPATTATALLHFIKFLWTKQEKAEMVSF